MCRLRSVALLAFTASCVAEPSAGDRGPTSQVAQPLGCSQFVCGENSCILGGFPFYELDETGELPSKDGRLHITEFVSMLGVPLKVSVLGSRLRGIDDDKVVYQGNALVGSKIRVKSDATDKHYEISIEQVNKTQYYELGDDGTDIDAYSMTVIEMGPIGAHPRQLCPIPNLDTAMFPGLQPYDAVIFRGDRYDVATGAVVASGAATGPWFNIACAGDALSKVLLIRHAQAAEDASHATSKDQRTAALRMFRADYCGTAQSMTELGVPLDWANRGAPLPGPPTPEWNTIGLPLTENNVEAIWSKGGARCLNTPRLVDIGDVPCHRPHCDAPMIANWKAHGDFITVVP